MRLKLGIGVAMMPLAGCGALEDERRAGLDPVLECVERGVGYFKAIRSYPVLLSPPNIGRAAEEVALERCRLATTAF